ncbi:hypothetical protein C8F04DRAFT_1173109 [Mycena alexandri]|uniref:Uncharacterized protein n=1 Tax=Mycena alexandri TaxID=1745969 RepID=A0AAD6TIX8_9AGAR|nr:hypothetical protein C8F04DRAFT_1173109 [Mycena alexandri]
MTEPSFNVPVLVEWLKHLPVRQTVSGSRDLRGTSQFIHNPSAFNIENLDTRLSLGLLNEKFKQVYVAVQSAFKRSRTVEDIQREMSLRCENGAKLLTRRHHALRRVTPRGVKSQYSSSNVGMQHERLYGRRERHRGSGSDTAPPCTSPRRAAHLQTSIFLLNCWQAALNELNTHSRRFLGLCEREWREITDAAPRALRRAAPHGFKTQYFPSKH